MFLNTMSRIHCKLQGFWCGLTSGSPPPGSAAGAARHYNLRLSTEGLRPGHGPAALGPAPGFKGYRPCRRPQRQDLMTGGGYLHDSFNTLWEVHVSFKTLWEIKVARCVETHFPTLFRIFEAMREAICIHIGQGGAMFSGWVATYKFMYTKVCIIQIYVHKG